jgi:hypothetical protein
MFDFLDRIDARITQFVLFVVLIISIISEYFSNVITLPMNWEQPIILTTLILIINMLRKIYDVDNTTKKIYDDLDCDALTKYDDYGLFYKDLDVAMKTAKISLDLTHIRAEPPAAFANSESYYDSQVDWCTKNKSAYLRRITTMSNEKMKKWIKELQKIENEISNYHIRLCDWSLEFPMINMAIVDKKMVFLVLTAGISEKTCAILIRDKKTTDYFIQYYENLWASSKRIPDTI